MNYVSDDSIFGRTTLSIGWIESKITANGRSGARSRTKTPYSPDVSPVTKDITITNVSAKSRSSVF